MTRTPRTPAAVVALVALVVAFGFAPSVFAAAAKKPQKKTATKTANSSRQEKSARAERGRNKASAKKKETARDTRAAKGRERGRAAVTRAEKSRERNDRSARGNRADDTQSKKRGGSRKERLAESRREAERRRREEAARRAEAARLAAIRRAEAIARQRAADQALRDEAAANILRDDPTGEDLEVRRVALDAVGNQAATVVVMEPKTGRVLSVVNQDWAMRKGFKPCSTIKLVTGLAGLSENVIDPVQTINIGVGSFRLDLTDSLAYSNNPYFQKVGGNVGFDKMVTYARELGLGAPTGINHPGESPGRVPAFKSGYAVNHMSSHGDDFEVTPIQLANMASTIANGGTLLVPHLPRTPQENVRFKTEKRRQVAIPADHLRRVLPGMIGAVTYGTAKPAQDPTQTIAGKTGSCTGQGSWLGLFTSFAPVHDPRLAVAVVLRGSGARGKYASAIAGNIYRRLNHRFGNRGLVAPPLVAESPRPKINPNAARAISDEENDADAATDAYIVSEATGAATDSTQAPASNVRSTSKSAPARPADAVAPRPVTTSPNQPQPNNNERPRRVEPLVP